MTPVFSGRTKLAILLAKYSLAQHTSTSSSCRALGKSIIAISLLFHKEMAKEKEPRGLMPLGTPQEFLLGHICRAW
jgi:hypothetical protein